MAKRYSIQIALDAAAAKQGIQAFTKLLGDADKAAERLGARLDKAFGASASVKRFNADLGLTHQIYAGLTRATQAYGDASVRSAGRAAQARKEQERVDVGYFKFVADALKRREKDELDARKRQVQWERQSVTSLEQLRRSAIEARSKAIDAQLKGEEDRKRQLTDWERKNVISLEQMSRSALDAKSKAIDAQIADEQAKKKRMIEWERANVYSMEQLHRSALDARSKDIDAHLKRYEDAKKKHVQWERANVISIEQMNRSALDARSRGIDQQLKQAKDARDKKIQWEREHVITADQLTRSLADAKSREIDKRLREEARFRAGFTKSLSDQEIAQRVANAKMQRNNDQRVEAAMKAAGLEGEASSKLLDSFGAMASGAAAAVISIGRITEAVNTYAEAVKGAAHAQGSMLDKFTGEIAQERQAAATLGRVNDRSFHRDIKAFQASTGMAHGEALRFFQSVGETSAQYVSVPGEKNAVGRTVTPEQYKSIIQAGGRFASAHGLTEETSARLLGEFIGSEDLRKLSTEEATQRVMQKYAAVTSGLEHGKGSNPILQGQFSEFYMAHKHQFRSEKDAAAFMSVLAQGIPAGEVNTAANALVMSIRNPNAQLRKLLQKVRFQGKGNANGFLLGRKKDAQLSESITAQEALEAIREYYAGMGLSGVELENRVMADFNLRKGAKGALQYFSAEGRTATQERMRHMAAHSTPEAIKRDLEERFKSQDLQLQVQTQKTEAAEADRQENDQAIATMLQEAKKARQLAGATGSTKESIELGFRKYGSFGFADTSEQRVAQVTAQELLLREIEQLDPRAGKREKESAKGFGYGVGTKNESINARLLELKKIRDQLRAKKGLPARDEILDMDQLRVRGGVPVRKAPAVPNQNARAQRFGKQPLDRIDRHASRVEVAGAQTPMGTDPEILKRLDRQNQLLAAILSNQTLPPGDFHAPPPLPLGSLPTQLVS